ncbi:helix-turn-helix transcriptional regulator [Nonomuraea sediminis]|uniref:helix-turn-helix transcriptional regulator n=1 Tax=Nonomuraea sediminis TaxID=2835864 RepID=UPI003557F8CE
MTRMARQYATIASIASRWQAATSVAKGGRDREGGSVTAKHLTPEDLAERVGVPVSTVYQWNSRGGGPRFMRIGRYVRYKIADVNAWEESLYAERVG